MNKLEQQIITKLKCFLSQYKMDIVKGSDTKDNTKATVFQNNYLVLSELFSNNLSSMVYYPYYWISVNDMLFAADNIFTFLYHTRRADIRCCIGASLEEIIIKMDLMGI